MPGIPTNSVYSPASADFVRYYAPNKYSKLWGWVPTGFDTQDDIPVVVFAHGGGWLSSTHFWDDTYNVMDDDYNLQTQPELMRSLPVDSFIFDRFLAAGYAVVCVEFPMGFSESPTGQVWPASRFPAIPRSIGLAIQMLKTWGYLGDIEVGGDTVNLSTSADRYITSGNSAGAIMCSWTAFLLDGALPYQKVEVGSHSISEWTPLFNHRVKGVINVDGICDFSRFEPTGQLAINAIAYFGNHNKWVTTGNRFEAVPTWLKQAASFLPLIERNAPDNVGVGIKAFSAGSAQNGWIFNQQSGGVANVSPPNVFVTKAALLNTWNTTTGAITGCQDVHEVAMFVKLEETLEGIIVANSSDPALYDVWWGNDINNTTGSPAAIWEPDVSLAEGTYDTTIIDFYDTLVPWATTTLGIEV